MTTSSKETYFVALTGGIACGKSTVAEFFIERNFDYFNADKVAHNCYLSESSIYNKILEIFGNEIINENKISRKKIAQKIFENDEKRLELNSLIHPIVKDEIVNWMENCKRKKINGVAEIPLLYESEINLLPWNYIISVFAKEKTIFKRLKNRGLSYRESLSRIRSQISINEKCKRSNYSVNGEDDLNNTKDLISKLLIKWKIEENS